MLVDLQQSFATFYNKYKDDYASEADAFIDFLASRELRSAVKSAQKKHLLEQNLKYQMH